MAGLPAQADTRAVNLADGAYLTTAAGCISCHTDSDNGGQAFAGGRALETPFGTFYTPNITPDGETGIGNWSDAEFVAALRHGTAPDGSHYYPSFPFASYAGISDADALAMRRYLNNIDPVHAVNKPHALDWYVPGRWAMALWQQWFAPWQYPPIAPGDAASVARGAYLVRHLAHCGECHTPRNRLGALQLTTELTGRGKTATDKGSPNISHTANGTGDWDQSDMELFLEMGILPDGDFVGGEMATVIDDNTSQLTAEDRTAIAYYLQTIH